MNHNRQIILATAFGIFIFAVALRLPTINSPFFYDDFHAAVNNPAVTGKVDIVRVFTDPSAFSLRPGRRMYRPITLLSYALCYRLFKANPVGWHAFNLFFHGIAAVLVFAVALRLFSGKIGPAAVSALWWSSHPLLNEAVVYQAARSSLLAAVAILAGIYFHLSVKTEWRRITAVCGCNIVGLGLKETAAVMPILLLLCDLASKKDIRDRLRTYTGSMLVVVLYLLLRRAVLGADTFSVSQPVRSVASNLLTQTTVVTAYISRSFWPVSSSIEWNWPDVVSILPTGLPWYFSPPADIPFILLLVLCVVLCFRRYPFFTLGVGWFLVALAPESSIIPLVQAANERRLYLPLMGIALVGGRCMEIIGAQRRFAVWAAAILIVGCLSAMTLTDASRWAGNEKLWESALKQSPSSLRALHGLAAARLDAGKLDSAEVLYNKLILEHPTYAGGYMGLGRILMMKGRYDEAEKNLVLATQLDLNNDTPWINLVELYNRQNRFAEAESTARKGLEIFAKSSVLWNNFGVALAFQGKFEEAIQAFDRALEINPNHINAARNRAKATSDLKNHK